MIRKRAGRQSQPDPSPKRTAGSLDTSSEKSLRRYTRGISTFIATEPSSLKDLWHILDHQARFCIVRDIVRYLDPAPEEIVRQDRAERAEIIIPALTKQISMLRKAYAARLTFENVEVPGLGRLALMDPPFYPLGAELSSILRAEMDRLVVLHERARLVYKQKRLGVPRSLQNLVTAQAFCQHWTKRRGELIRLTPNHIADIIRFAFLVDDVDGGDSYDPENLRKALTHFRSNPDNRVLLELIDEAALGAVGRDGT